MYQIILERDDCTMCGHCVELDETLFNFDDDDKATLIGSERDGNTDELMVEDAEIYEEGSLIVDARIFADIVRKLPDGPVEIETDSKNELKINCLNTN